MAKKKPVISTTERPVKRREEVPLESGPPETKLVSLIKVLIADDRKLILEALQFALQQEKSIKIVGEAVNGIQTTSMVFELKPDVLLLNPKANGLADGDAVSTILTLSPTTKILLLSFPEDETVIIKALVAGAKGYVSKTTGLRELCKAVEAVHRGELWVERRLMSRILDERVSARPSRKNGYEEPKEILTPREQEVLRCLSTGITNKEIAGELYISEKTVKSHLNSIFRKFNVTKRLQAILYAVNKGLT
jgi:DNA-binding NarL/FixJ family response regulator